MSREGIEKRVKESLAYNLFNIEEHNIKDDSKIVDDLGADSLDVVELIIKAEQTFNIQITDDEAENLITVKDVVDLIEKKITK